MYSPAIDYFSNLPIRGIHLSLTPLAASQNLAMGSDDMRIPVGAPAQHHFMPVEHGHQLHPSHRRHLTIQDSHLRRTLSMYTIPRLRLQEA